MILLRDFYQGVELLALSGEAGKSKKQNPPKPDVQVVYKEAKKTSENNQYQVGGRRMRSMDKLNITKEQR